MRVRIQAPGVLKNRTTGLVNAITDQIITLEYTSQEASKPLVRQIPFTGVEQIELSRGMD